MPSPLHVFTPVHELGSSALVMLVQLPGELPLQVWQLPHAAMLQHTLSTQVPTLHWFVAVQPCPSPTFIVHTPFGGLAQ
jgi:hypothetical protein